MAVSGVRTVKQSVVVHAFNPSIWEADLRVPGQPGLQKNPAKSEEKKREEKDLLVLAAV